MKPDEPKGAIRTPPSDLRCSYVFPPGHPKENERCGAWAARRRGYDKCAGHAGIGPSKLAEAREDTADAARLTAIRQAEAAFARAEAAVEQADPLDPEGFIEKTTARDLARADLARAEHLYDTVMGDRLQPPERTPEMEAAGLFWARQGLDPALRTPNALRDSDGAFFRWVQRPARVPGLPDGDVERVRVEHAEKRDLAAGNDDRSLMRRAQELNARYAEVTANGYAAMYWAGQAGMSPQDYVADLERQINDVFGHPVDLEGAAADDWENVIRPTLQREARLRSWARVFPS